MTCLSEPTARKLQEWGCDVPAQKVYVFNDVQTYDILYDVCVKYPKEFFGEKELAWAIDSTSDKKEHITTWSVKIKSGYSWEYHTSQILPLLQQNKIDEAEQYILDNCVFNPKNK
jgi:hypothetical protein